ncbi:unnamed protein product [Rotaria socialis]|uniref:Uncharacterized protein n=1 Tax=Rotaria socialis TaxID=392032 RepID=A0A817YUR1_9BILA|nr:unnamed protein product [Rotaria socialis]CAF3384027.1 unnamed protein product [Rotaria socialis]CAF3647776.1 unnamed protein product [Rotaria socialis]CAF4217280.1 unnamed protein product [Rotaria socialis]CAF4322392.1 unnamed protein product [Rotaria socialis]
MANNSNFTNNLEHTLDELLADLKNHNFVDSFPAETNVQFNISVNDPDLVNLKTKIVDFLEQHPTIVNEIKKYFYEDLILYTLRRALNSSCTMHDITKTRATLSKFFRTPDQTIRIIFDHFFDDVKPLILKSKQRYAKRLYQLIHLAPNVLVRESLIAYLQKSGASVLTALMYGNQTNLVQQEVSIFSNRSSLLRQPFLHDMKSFLLLSFFILMCIIFGFKIFHLIFYYFIGLLCTVFVLYILVEV